MLSRSEKKQDNQLMHITGIIGILAATLMFCGDMLLYFTPNDYPVTGTLEPYIDIMKDFPRWRLFLGGLLGPIAAFLYCVGYYHIKLAIHSQSKRLACIMYSLFSVGIIIGGAYHSQFTYIGLIGSIENEQAIDLVMENITALSSVSMIPIGIASLILAYLILTKKTIYPRWFILVTPVVLIFLSNIMALLPQPFRVILLGGWNNLLFIIFFFASVVFSEARSKNKKGA